MYPNNLVVMFVFRKFGFEFIGGDQRVANATFSQSITTKGVSPLFITTRLFEKVSPALIISRAKQNSEALDDMGTKADNSALQGHWCGMVSVTQKTVKLLIGTTKL